MGQRTMLRGTIGIALVTLLGAGCKDPQPPAAPTPVAASLTDSFSGSLLVAGNNSHTFNVQAVGGVSVSLTSVEPGAALRIGVGTPSGASCLVTTGSFLTVVPGPQAQLVGTATVTGELCVSVSDAGNLVEPVSYTVVVFHS